MFTNVPVRRAGDCQRRESITRRGRERAGQHARKRAVGQRRIAADRQAVVLRPGRRAADVDQQRAIEHNLAGDRENPRAAESAGGNAAKR